MVTPAFIWHLTFCPLPGGSLGLQLKYFPCAWSHDEKSYIAGLVHVGQEPGDGHVSDGLLEEHLLNGGRADGAEGRQEQEQLPEATWLSRVPEIHRTGSKSASLRGAARSLFNQCAPVTESCSLKARFICGTCAKSQQPAVAYCLVNFLISASADSCWQETVRRVCAQRHQRIACVQSHLVCM